MKHSSFASLPKRLTFFILLVTVLPVLASEHGGGEKPAGPEPLQFTVNIADAEASDRYLQLTMAFDLAKPETSHRLAEIKPKIQHRVILLLSGENVATLRTTKGKLDLQERVRNEVNDLLEETPKTGVRDVFFTDFIIQ